jgi:tRNA threonylcarbamoyladenosine biosynthesis protein TsaE
METVKLVSLKDTETLAKRVSELLNKPRVIALIGDLGTGKTTFTKALITILGSDDTPSSPSFVLENLYKTTIGEVSHWDLYRLDSPPAELLERLGCESTTIIEWADKFPEIIRLADIVIKFSIVHIDEQNKIERRADITLQRHD